MSRSSHLPSPPSPLPQSRERGELLAPFSRLCGRGDGGEGVPLNHSKAALIIFLLVAPILFAAAADPPEGIRPLGADGKPLNLDFETGDLRDWTATGDAFEGQPIAGDAVSARRSDMASQHQGKYWI